MIDGILIEKAGGTFGPDKNYDRKVHKYAWWKCDWGLFVKREN
jgi:hypothetical protein